METHTHTQRHTHTHLRTQKHNTERDTHTHKHTHTYICTKKRVLKRTAGRQAENTHTHIHTHSLCWSACSQDTQRRILKKNTRIEAKWYAQRRHTHRNTHRGASFRQVGQIGRQTEKGRRASLCLCVFAVWLRVSSNCLAVCLRVRQTDTNIDSVFLFCAHLFVSIVCILYISI